MAQENFEGVERKRFPALMLLGLALAAVVIVVGFLIDTEYGIPLLLLTVICALAAIAYRVLAGSQRSDADSGDNVPKQPATGDDRPLGDTAEAHDEINPHDLPLDSPARRAAERQSGGIEGTTTGPLHR